MDSGYLYFDTISHHIKPYPDTLWLDQANGIYHFTANPDSLGRLAFEENEVFAGLLSKPKFITKDSVFTLVFGLPRSMVIENQVDSIAKLEMDFDDGNGFVPISFDTPKSITYNLSKSTEGGEKELRLRFHYNLSNPFNQKVVETKMKLRVLQNVSGADEVIYSNALNYTCPIKTNGIVPDIARFSIRYGNSDKKILKPVLLVEGYESSTNDYGLIDFDGLSMGTITDDRTNEEVMTQLKLMKNFLDSLHSLGYDIIYQDNRVSQDAIQANALNTIKIIQWINAQLDTNESHEKLVVIGASMGGLLTRYALSKMEAEGCCHNTRLYGTFDCPHNGAHMPLGLQTMVKHLHDQLGWMDPIRGLFDMEPIKPHWEGSLNSIGARQMLVGHIGDGALKDREAFVKEFDSLGHPQQCRQIAIINGSEQGLGNTISDVNKTYILCEPQIWLPVAHHVGTTWEPWANIIGIPIPFKTVVLNAFAESNPDGIIFQGNDVTNASHIGTLICIGHGVSVSLQLIGQGLMIFPSLAPFVSPVIIGLQGVSNGFLPPMHLLNLMDDVFLSSSISWISKGNTNYSESPGSTRSTPFEVTKAMGGLASLITPNHSFIPSVSSLDLDTTNLYVHIKNNRIPYILNGRIPFDTYWAPGRGDEEVDRNMQHVEVSKDLYKWLIIQIDHNDDLRDSSGLYFAKLNGYYNFGRTADFEDPFLKHLYSVDIESGGKLHINTEGKIGFLSSPYSSPQGSSFTCFTGQSCESPHVKVKSGGVFEIGKTLTKNTADMFFLEGSTLEILQGGTLRIHDLSRLIIEDGAELIIHPGAVIDLKGENAEVILRGLVTLEEEAVFTFSGEGFVTFDQNTDMTQAGMNAYWNFEGDNAIILNGSGKSTDKLAVVLSDLHLSGGLDSLNIDSGKVEMASNVNLSVRGGLVLDEVLIYSSDTTHFSDNYGHVLTFGQSNLSISNSDFVGGKKGLYMMNVLGQPGSFQVLSDCIWRKCETGLQTDGKSVKISSSEFEGNVDGWRGQNMTEGCQVVASQFYNNSGSGIEYFGQSSSTLTLRSCDVSENYDGLYIKGAHLRSDCSQFYDNDQSGVYISNGSGYFDFDAGNGFTNNTTGIALYESTGLSLEDGYNSFSGNTMDISGTFEVNAILDSYNSLPALNLKNNYFSSGPVNLPIALTIDGRTVNTFNYSTVFSSPCSSVGVTGKTLGEMSEEYSSDQVFVVGGKSTSSGLYFSSGDPMDLSIQESLDYISTYENSCDDLEASSRLIELLNSGFAPNTYSEEQLYELAYKGLLASITNAYLLDSLDGGRASLNPSAELTQAVNTIDQRIANLSASDSSYLERTFEWKLDKALLYRAANHYSLALQGLDSLVNVVFPSDQSLRAQRWKCICESESELLDSTITLIQYMDAISMCDQYNPQKAHHLVVGVSQPLSYFNPTQKLATLFPNPTRNQSQLVFHLAHKGGVVNVVDITGRMVRTYIVHQDQNKVILRKEPPGTYVVRIVINGFEPETQKWIVEE
ncbi:MAG: hypothetical protein SchgKO_25540 [Schleiferiaceae bacterium]